MNLKYKKALYLLDKERYEEAEDCLRMAIEECDNRYELAEINSCYALLLYEEERYEEAMKCVNYILENTSEYDDIPERETAIEIKNEIENLVVSGKYLDDNGYFDENELYILRGASDEYREEYFSELSKESDIMNEIYSDEEFRDEKWENLFTNGLVLFIIEKSTNHLCGYLELKSPASDMPEIGFKIFNQYQQKDTGYQAIMLMLKKLQSINTAESYSIKIDTEDILSQRLVERIGAVKTGEEVAETEKLFKGSLDNLNGKEFARMLRIYGEVYKDDEPKVYVYELDKDKIRNNYL